MTGDPSIDSVLGGLYGLLGLGMLFEFGVLIVRTAIRGGGDSDE